MSSLLERLDSTRLVAAALVLLGAFIALQRLHTYDEPLERDLSLYAVTAHEMLEGRALYTDLWTHRPPAIFATYAAAEMLVGFGPRAVYLLSVLGACLVLAGVYHAASARGGGWKTGLWAALFWTLLSGDLFFQSNQPNTELFINACAAFAFALLVETDAGSLRWKRCAAIGLLFGAASAYKPLALLTGISLCAAHVILPPEGGRRTALRQAGVVAGTVALIWVLILGWYAARGAFGAFYEANVVFNRFYAGSVTRNILTAFSFRNLVPQAFASLVPLCFTIPLAAIHLWSEDRRRGLFMAAWIAAAFLQVALPGKFYYHYYQFWMPIIAVNCAWGVRAAAPVLKLSRPGIAAAVAGTIAAGFILWREIPFYLVPAAAWPEHKYGHTYFPAAKRLGLELGGMLGPEETFFQWGYEPGLYYYARRSPPAGVLHINPLLEGPLRQSLTRDVLASLERERPAYLALSRWTYRDVPPDHPIHLWFTEHYRPFPGNDRGHFVLFKRNPA